MKDDVIYRGYTIRKARGGYQVTKPTESKPYWSQPSMEFAKKVIDQQFEEIEAGVKAIRKSASWKEVS